MDQCQGGGPAGPPPFVCGPGSGMCCSGLHRRIGLPDGMADGWVRGRVNGTVRFARLACAGKLPHGRSFALRGVGNPFPALPGQNKSRPVSEPAGLLAEEEGFEPSLPGLRVKRFSRPPHSTALPPLRDDWPNSHMRPFIIPGFQTRTTEQWKIHTRLPLRGCSCRPGFSCPMRRRVLFSRSLAAVAAGACVGWARACVGFCFFP